MREEDLTEAINEYFNTGDSYIYILTRTKTAFSLGTVTLDDYVEWSEDDTAELVSHILETKKSS